MRLRPLLAGVACLAGAVLLAPPAPRSGGSLAGAIGRSIGGLRIVLLDVLFIRADALVAAGRPGDLAEAQELYETILELDPANDTAQSYLVDMYVRQMLPFATTPAARFEWWHAGWKLAHRGLSLNPRSAQLHFRIAEMLVDAQTSRIAYVRTLGPFVERLVPDLRTQVLRHLLEAVRSRENLPNRGFTHLSLLAIVAPEYAADAARTGDRALLARALAAGEELLGRHGARLSEIFTEVAPVPGGRTGTIDRASLLRAGLTAVRRIQAARRAGDPARARRVVEAYAEVAGRHRVLEALTRLAGG